jgi:hypothetical protein
MPLRVIGHSAILAFLKSPVSSPVIRFIKATPRNAFRASIAMIPLQRSDFDAPYLRFRPNFFRLQQPKRKDFWFQRAVPAMALILYRLDDFTIASDYYYCRLA